MSAGDRSNQPERPSNRCADLIGVLDQMERTCGVLLEITEKERIAVIDGSLEALDQLSQEKRDLVDRVEKLEKMRLEASIELGEELKLRTDASLAELATRVVGPGGTQLSEARGRILGLVTRLQDANNGNILLVRRSLDLVGDSIKQVRRSLRSESYGSDGNLVPRGASAFGPALAIDCRA